MCLTNEGREQVSRWARQQSDEDLQEYIDSQPRNGFSTLNAHINHIIQLEIQERLLFRRRQLKRSLWLSTRHGRMVEAIKRWLIRHRLWSSTLRWPRLPSLLDLLHGLFAALLKRLLESRRLQQASLHQDQTSLGRIRRPIHDDPSP